MTPHDMSCGRTLTVRRAAIIVFAAALAVRLLYLVTLPAAPFLHEPHSDHANYFSWADLLASGAGVTLDRSIQQPAYALLLTPWLRLFPDSAIALPLTRFGHALAGALAAGLLTLLAARFLNPRWSLLAGLLYALSPVTVFTDLTWSKEQLAVTCWLTVMLLINRPDWPGRIAAVTLSVLAIGLRELFVVPLLLAATAWYLPRAAWRKLFGALLLIGWSLWGWSWLHTAMRDGSPPQGFAEPLYVGVWSGTGVLYCPPSFVRPGRNYEAVDWQVETARRLGHWPTPVEENAYWLSAAGAEISAHPLTTLRVMAMRTATALWAGPLEDNYPYLVHYHSSPVLPVLTPVWLLFTLGLGGLMVWWRSGSARGACCIVTALLLGTLLAPAPFYILERLRLPLYALFALSAAAGLAVAPRVPRYWLLGYALAAALTLNPALTAQLAPAILRGTRLGWHMLTIY